MTTFEEEIEKTGKLIYTNVGDSMMPLIKQGRDILIIEKACGRLKKYDVKYLLQISQDIFRDSMQ